MEAHNVTGIRSPAVLSVDGAVAPNPCKHNVKYQFYNSVVVCMATI